MIVVSIVDIAAEFMHIRMHKISNEVKTPLKAWNYYVNWGQT